MWIRLFLSAVQLGVFLPPAAPCAYFPRLVPFPVLLEPAPPVPRRPACAPTGFLARVSYHPTVLLQKHSVMEAPRNSACMRCGLCIAVAEKLEHILRFALASSISLQDFDDYLSAQLLRPICDFSFQSYGLKEWKGLRVISQYGFLDSVPNSLEGRWWEILKDSCHFYLTHFGEGNLVRSWLVESNNVTALLCRNDGLFRDCFNIEEGVLTIQLPRKFLTPSKVVRITYPCP